MFLYVDLCGFVEQSRLGGGKIKIKKKILAMLSVNIFHEK